MLRARGPGMTRVAIGSATFYTDLAERLESSAVRSLQEAGITAIDRSRCRRLRAPVIAKYAADAGYDAVVLLGAVIRGQTSHYDHVCEEVARGIMEVQLTTGVPCGFGVLTVESQNRPSHAPAVASATAANMPLRQSWRFWPPNGATSHGSSLVATAAIIFTIDIHTLGIP